MGKNKSSFLKSHQVVNLQFRTRDLQKLFDLAKSKKKPYLWEVIVMTSCILSSKTDIVNCCCCNILRKHQLQLIKVFRSANKSLDSGQQQQTSFRQNESPKSYRVRMEEDRLRHRTSRADESTDEVSHRQHEDRLRHRKLRADESADNRIHRVDKERLRHAAARANESSDAKSNRRKAESIRIRSG